MHGVFNTSVLPPFISVSKKCVKCKEASAAVVIRAGDTYLQLSGRVIPQ
uniref:Uncharacterized protein n=1 Tax=Seriola lalandi dorsalis TaxID=1841481 RepID=A0A3B4WIL2_SERLL